jgi:hypothetical protein
VSYGSTALSPAFVKLLGVATKEVDLAESWDNGMSFLSRLAFIIFLKGRGPKISFSSSEFSFVEFVITLSLFYWEQSVAALLFFSRNFILSLVSSALRSLPIRVVIVFTLKLITARQI